MWHSRLLGPLVNYRGNFEYDPRAWKERVLLQEMEIEKKPQKRFSKKGF
jgi:hypothetical protein